MGREETAETIKGLGLFFPSLEISKSLLFDEENKEWKGSLEVLY